MFEFNSAFSGFAVDDVETARDFYERVLGIRTSATDVHLFTLHLPGDRDTIAYAKADHQPATYTILNFEVGDIEAAVDALAAAGVQTERYDGFDQDEKGIARGRGQGPDIAWFKDPAGNILSLIEA